MADSRNIGEYPDGPARHCKDAPAVVCGCGKPGFAHLNPGGWQPGRCNACWGNPRSEPARLSLPAGQR